MPCQILPDEEAFASFKQKLLALEFRELTNEEFFKSFKRLGLEAPRPLEGRETGFIFAANDLKVYVWTTYLSSARKSRDSDAGWVLIAEGDKARYFTHPLRRTKNFLLKLSRYAWVARWRVLNRPLCPQCHNYMRIAYGLALKSRYWRCDHKESHDPRRPIFISWDHGMPPKALSFIKRERKPRRKYRETRKKEGRPNNVAMLNRKKWTKYRPENSV